MIILKAETFSMVQITGFQLEALLHLGTVIVEPFYGCAIMRGGGVLRRWASGGQGAGMVLNLCKCTGSTPTVNNGMTPNVSTVHGKKLAQINSSCFSSPSHRCFHLCPHGRALSCRLYKMCIGTEVQHHSSDPDAFFLVTCIANSFQSP